MSTESERVHSSSDALDGSNASRVEVGSEQKSETLADPSSGQDQELEAKRDGDEGLVAAEPLIESLASSVGNLEMEKINGFTDVAKETESVAGGLDLGVGTQNVDVKTNESEKKVPVGSEEVMTVKGDDKALCEKDSDGIQTELLVDKEVEPDMVSSHGANLSGVKVYDVRLGSEEDLVEDSKPVGSGKQGTKAENLDIECFMGLEPHESKDETTLDNDNAPVTTKVKLSESDLVWAKVRSHPWWPGQVFDASAATDKANKYFKKGSFLVTYFGDCSFAWNDASRIKPFRQHFSQMSKQSSLPDFLDAIDFALEEVSRRIEFGLACSCISEEVYQKIKTQNIINPGIREDSSSIHGGDKVSSAISFEPSNLVDYVKRLACSPSYSATDELQFVSQRARLLAFNRWKGYTDLPEFETLQGSVESAPKISRAEEESRLVEVKESVSEPKKAKQVYTKRRKTEVQDDGKHDGVFEYEDTTVPKKKEKTLAEFIAEKRLSRSKVNRSGEESDMKPDCEKKRKTVPSKLPKSAKKTKANLQTEDSGSPLSPKNDRKDNLSAGDKITPKKARTSFGIGASILRVANQMHCSPPVGPIPCRNSTSKMAAKNDGSGKSLQDRSKAEALSERETSPNEAVLRPHSASATKTPNGKPSPVSIANPQSGELEQVIKGKPITNPVEDSMLESRELKGSSKEQMVNEDEKEAANTVGEMTVEESNLTEEKITGSDLKEQPGNKNCSDGSVSCCKEDSSAE